MSFDHPYISVYVCSPLICFYSHKLSCQFIIILFTYSRLASCMQWYIKHTMKTCLIWGTEQSVDMLQIFECQQQWCCALYSQDRETLSTLRGIHCYRWIPYQKDRTRNIFFRSCNTMCYALCHSLHFIHRWLLTNDLGALIIYTWGKIAKCTSSSK